MSGLEEETEASDASCVFCRHIELSAILHETEHFLVLADHAPVVEGHLLILPRAHFACYGAIPAALDAEFLSLKALVSAFCELSYQTPVFFEHGVFHQTVFHAHLHVFPFGGLPEEMSHQLTADGHTIQSQEDVRTWYQIRGHYFYLESSASQSGSPAAAVFPPDNQLYYYVLGSLRTQTGEPGGWQPPPLRYLTRAAKIQAVATAWQRFAEISV